MAELEHHGVDFTGGGAGSVVGDKVFWEGADLSEYFGGVLALLEDGLDLLVAALEGSGLGGFSGLEPGLLGWDADFPGAAEDFAEVCHGLMLGVSAKDGDCAKECGEQWAADGCEYADGGNESPEGDEQGEYLKEEAVEIESGESVFKVDVLNDGKDDRGEMKDEEGVAEFSLYAPIGFVVAQVTVG